MIKRYIYNNFLTLFLLTLIDKIKIKVIDSLINGEESPCKDLLRPNANVCPGCHGKENSIVGKLPYFKTHLSRWNAGILNYYRIVPSRYRFCCFDVFTCNHCGLVYIPASYKDFTEEVESHPVYFSKTLAPYLCQTQINSTDALVKRINEAGENDLGIIESRFKCFGQMIDSMLSSGMRFLDLGSNMGSFAEFVRLSRPDVTVNGCEISSYYVQECKKKYPELEVISEKLSSSKEHGKFDLIFCCDVIEHIWDIDEFILAVRNNLEMNGLFMIVTPDLACSEAKKMGLEWWSFIVPHHAQFFTINSLSTLLQRHGFSLESNGCSGEEFWAVFKRGNEQQRLRKEDLQPDRINTVSCIDKGMR